MKERYSLLDPPLAGYFMNYLLEKLLGIDQTVSASGDWHIVWRSAPAAWLLWLIIIPAVLLFLEILFLPAHLLVLLFHPVSLLQ